MLRFFRRYKPVDLSVIDINTPKDLKYWVSEFGLSEKSLKMVIEFTGEKVDDVKAFLDSVFYPE